MEWHRCQGLTRLVKANPIMISAGTSSGQAAVIDPLFPLPPELGLGRGRIVIAIEAVLHEQRKSFELQTRVNEETSLPLHESGCSPG